MKNMVFISRKHLSVIKQSNTNMEKKKKKDDKETGNTVAETIKEIKARFGDDSIMKMDQKPDVGIDCIPTGSFGLNVALGIGGFPRGRIAEIYGPESSGKTTLALHVVAESQKSNGVCAYIDAEHAMDPVYAKAIGVDTSNLFISQPQSGEQALEIVESLIRSGKFDVVVVDSVASLTPKAEIEGEMGEQHVGRQARLMSQAMRKLTAIAAKSKTVLIFINQIRTNIGMMFPGAPTEFTPGGKALKFYSSVRLEIRRIAQIKKGEEVVGGRVRVKVVKNKVASPYKQTEFDLMYGEGISREGEILALGEKLGILNHSGNSYKFGDNIIGRGYDSARQYLKANPEIREDIFKKINDKINVEESNTSENVQEESGQEREPNSEGVLGL